MVVAKNSIITQHDAMTDKTQVHEINYSNLDVIISVGYRVNSIQATRFRHKPYSI
ncbi:RhuM family protein [Lactobacillus sp. AN1001]